ncbi:MAG: hypothetical protein KY476_19795 [Planctomycetes bacterium]|nr:hypothetical protein [Planctomycetota bacterium]
MRGFVALAASVVAGLAVRSAEAATDAEVKAAVARAAEFLRGQMATSGAGQDSIQGYALLKAGEPKGSPHIARTLARIRSEISGGVYRLNSDRIYKAAVDVMFLEALDPEGLRDEIQAIVNYLIGQQMPTGGWDYIGVTIEGGGGDTSQAQYALLAFWAAERAGGDIPGQVWDRAAAWHLRAQLPNGAGSYHPLGSGRVPTHTMTSALIGSLAMCRMHLHPSAGEVTGLQAAPKEPPPSRTRFGVLSRIDVTTPENQPSQTVAAQRNYKPTVPAGALEAAIQKGMGWMSQFYRIQVDHYPLYYLYGLERMAALAGVEEIAGHDWYAEGVDFLLKTQKKDGSWQGAQEAGVGPSTAFGVLFLLRATSKLLGRPPRALEMIGGGLLKGGRGLPDSLGSAVLDDGRVTARKITDPIEQLLVQLEKQEGLEVEAVQQAIVEQVQLGDREELIGQKDQLVKLADDRRPEVRRTALWALGHSDDLGLARVMIRALEEDPDLGVLIEARNALCTLSRKPTGFGLPDDPYAGLPEGATDEMHRAALEKWRAEALKRWKSWYLQVRPYDERDDLLEVKRTAR